MVGTLAMVLPQSTSPRLWTGAAAMMLVPWLVLGRSDRLRREGWLETLCGARRSWRWSLAELLAPALVVVAGAAVAGAGSAGPTAALLAWGLFVLAVADRADRRASHAGAAALPTFALLLGLFTAPWLAAPAFGQGLGHWPATIVFGLHPVGVALSAAGRSPLQDPFFYTWTLSGTVDARPLPPNVGLTLWVVVALVAGIVATRGLQKLRRGVES
jgi:hypothetical protein